MVNVRPLVSTLVSNTLAVILFERFSRYSGGSVKIATFNINGVHKRLENLLTWLAKAKPDIVCLQELKAEQGAFPVQALRNLGYETVCEGERSWNGVAILSRNRSPVLTRSTLPGNSGDRQARYIEAAVNGVLISSIYLPNGNPHPGPKFNYKLAWFERLIAHAAELFAAGVPVVLAGDYNVVPTPQDIYPTRSLDNNALIQPESRQAFARLLAQGWTDAMRKLGPEGPLWTFWDYERERWPKDKGLDHFLLSPEMSKQLVDGGIDRWVRGEVNHITEFRGLMDRKWTGSNPNPILYRRPYHQRICPCAAN
jgi:exodeoxyribonuclease-3